MSSLPGQLDLFSADLSKTPSKKLARRTDPDSSHSAAENAVLENRVESQKNRLAKALEKHPGLTSRELAEVLRIDRHLVARRLPDLEKESPPRSKKGDSRSCTIGNRQAVTWWPVH